MLIELRSTYCLAFAKKLGEKKQLLNNVKRRHASPLGVVHTHATDPLAGCALGGGVVQYLSWGGSLASPNRIDSVSDSISRPKVDITFSILV